MKKDILVAWVCLAKFKKRGVNIKRDVAPNTLNKGYEYKINKCKTALYISPKWAFIEFKDLFCVWWNYDVRLKIGMHGFKF